MKKIIIIFSLCLLSCIDIYDYPPPTYDIPIGWATDCITDPFDYPEIVPDISTEFKTIICLFRYVEGIIQYKEDKEDEWAEPDETYERKYGDCEDKALLLLWLIYQELNIKGKLYIYSSSKCGHASVIIDEWIIGYKPKCEEKYNKYIFKFNDALKIAKYKW